MAFTLKVPRSEIIFILENIDKFYYEKREPKIDKKSGHPKIKRGKIQERVLNPSLKRLKVIQRRILRDIFSRIEMPDYAYGSITARDNIKNAQKHKGKKYKFMTDLGDFFPSINNKQVFDMFRSFNFSPSVSRHLTKLTTYKGHLPQGAPTSPAVANLVFISTGQKLQNFAKKNHLTFTSFVDDLTFSSPIDFKPKAQEIITIIQEDGFRISHNKTNYKTKNPVVTGIVVKNNSVGLTDSFKIKLMEVDTKTESEKRGLELYARRVKESNFK
ncbi:MAG: reverse transcriptase family protein [Flavobacteriales bacterium]